MGTLLALVLASVLPGHPYPHPTSCLREPPPSPRELCMYGRTPIIFDVQQHMVYAALPGGVTVGLPFPPH